MSGRRGTRPTFFVCVAIDNGNLITKVIAAATVVDAKTTFKTQYVVEPQEVMGPFFKKRAQVLENTRTLKFSNQTKRAIYNDWLVNAFLLKEPENQAYLVFIKRNDDKKQPAPQGTIIVPVSELRFL